MIVGTAGHIDHGKTSLVKALTGVDTDRLKEEKARGISIELGYAYLPQADGPVLGFVDVPGHEKFVDHMVSGATGIDFVLLVIAADDGPMPQTVEHLDIVQLLGVREGAVAVTKVDRVDAARRAEVEKEIRGLAAATFLRDSRIFPVSSVTGEGLPGLKDFLAEKNREAHRARPGAGFRLAVDRCFTLGGTGTVVTGTVFAGEVKVGDEVRITPSGATARVRSIHAQNRAAQAGRAGERCALALPGTPKESIARGEWVVAPQLHAPTQRFDARLRLSAREAKAFRHWSAVHLHLGAEHVMARIALLEGESLAPGAGALAQVVTERPIGALAGDAFVVRDAAASRTLGGGRVVDPFAPARKRRAPERLAALRCMEEPDPARRIASLLAHSDQGLNLGALLLAANASPAGIALDPSVHRVRDGEFDFAFGGATWKKLAERFLAQLADYHAKKPDELGPDTGRVRRMWFPQLDLAVVSAVAKSLLDSGRLARTGPWWHLPAHSAEFSQRDKVLSEGILPLVEAGEYDPPWVRDLAKKLRAPEQDVRSLLVRLARRGDVFQVVKDLFYSRKSIGRLARIAKQLDDQAGVVRAAAFRDEIGLGRKRAIQILEFFDRIGYTRRAKDDHRIRGDNLLRLEEHRA
jgi:selenocysteine-specific elongation factor